MIQRTIRAAAEEVGVTPGTLRRYEQLGLLRPARDSTGRRVYGDGEVALARAIRLQRMATRGSGLRNSLKAASA
jgi:DNA-binding transcriptional MerR regulator